MNKLKPYDEKYAGLYQFECPGCGCLHWVQTVKATEFSHLVWNFNGNFEYPTIRPSIRVTAKYAGIETCCHFFITDGIIEYLNDCTHSLSGQKVSMIDL